MIADRPRARTRLAALVSAAFVATTLPRLLAHELWRDEAWLWLVAVQSGSLGELVEPLGRSGQGYLFPFLAWAAARLWESPRALQLLHLALGAAATFVFVRWAPFGRTERVLFAFGYFPFYEYAVISRHYVLGALLLWLACLAAVRRGRRAALGLGAALGLLCQTTVYGFVLALAVAAGWAARRALEDGRLPRPNGAGLAGAALALAGVAAGLVQLVPAEGTSFAPGWRWDWDAARAVEVIAGPWRVAVPLPPADVQFWNRNLLDPWPAAQAAAGLLILVVVVALLGRRRAALAAFGLGAAGLLAFAYLKYPGTLRHLGHWWLLAAAALWLDRGLAPRAEPGWRRAAVRGLLVVHGLAALFASAVDLRHPFSNAAATAQLLRDSGLDRLPLLGWREPPAAPVALALGRPLYAPSRKVWATHPDWGPEQRELTPAEVRCVARDLARRQASDVALVVNRELPPWGEIEPAGARTGAIQPSEDYRLYRLRRDRLAATAAAAACPAELSPGPAPRAPARASSGAPAPRRRRRAGRGRSSAARRGRG
jgi:hypothetical protein